MILVKISSVLFLVVIITGLFYFLHACLEGIGTSCNLRASHRMSLTLYEVLPEEFMLWGGESGSVDSKVKLGTYCWHGQGNSPFTICPN